MDRFCVLFFIVFYVIIIQLVVSLVSILIPCVVVWCVFSGKPWKLCKVTVTSLIDRSFFRNVNSVGQLKYVTYMEARCINFVTYFILCVEELKRHDP